MLYRHLNMKVLTFAKDEDVEFFFKPLLTRVMTKGVTNVSHHLKLLSLVQRLK